MLEITESNFTAEVEQSPLPVLIDFWASWCGPCMQMTSIVEEIAEAYRGRLKVVKVNVEQAASVAMRFGIRGIPAFLIVKGGQVRAQWTGKQSRKSMEERILREL